MAKIKINRAPVLTLWATVVAERQGYDPKEALTLGRGLTGLNAQSKGRRLGLYEKKTKSLTSKETGKEKYSIPGSVRLLGREIQVIRTAHGLRAAAGGRAIQPETVQRYLEQKFGDDLAEVRAAMVKLAMTYTPVRLEAEALSLYEKFRPKIPEGRKGWGVKGELDLNVIDSLAG